jgi:hypothetical protein
MGDAHPLDVQLPTPGPASSSNAVGLHCNHPFRKQLTRRIVSATTPGEISTRRGMIAVWSGRLSRQHVADPRVDRHDAGAAQVGGRWRPAPAPPRCGIPLRVPQQRVPPQLNRCLLARGLHADAAWPRAMAASRRSPRPARRPADRARWPRCSAYFPVSYDAAAPAVTWTHAADLAIRRSPGRPTT